VIINEYLAPFIRNYEGGCSLIQDNDSKHKSHICNAALFNNNIRWIKIEIKRYVRKRPCRTAGDLVYRIQKFFRFKLDVAKCRAYISHLRKVLQIIIDRRGDWSDC